MHFAPKEVPRDTRRDCAIFSLEISDDGNKTRNT